MKETGRPNRGGTVSTVRSKPSGTKRTDYRYGGK